MQKAEALRNLRREFYQQYPEFFSDFEDLEYGMYEVRTLPSELIEEINHATEELWTIFKKAKEWVLQRSPEEFVDLGYSKEMYEIVQADYLSAHTVVSRFDFILNNEQIKMIELNNDTPFLLMETFRMNQELCNEFGVKNPYRRNHIQLLDSYLNAIYDCRDYLRKRSIFDLNIVVTSQDPETDKEEYQTVQFIYDLIGDHLPLVSFEDIKDLRVVSEDEAGFERGLYTSDLRKIDILIKPAHPIEFLLEDRAADGEQIGLEILKMVQERRLTLLNPPSSYVLQSKAIMALIWEWYQNNIILSEHEQVIVEKYMLPTYFTDLPFKLQGTDYVQKPVFSREGNSVTIIKQGEMIQSEQNFYDNEAMIYQEYMEMPSDELLINGEAIRKKYLVGSFIVNNQAAGIAARYGDDITEWNCHWMAIGEEEE